MCSGMRTADDDCCRTNKFLTGGPYRSDLYRRAKLLMKHTIYVPGRASPKVGSVAQQDPIVIDAKDDWPFRRPLHHEMVKPRVLKGRSEATTGIRTSNPLRRVIP